MIDETVGEEDNPRRVNISLTTSKQSSNSLTLNKGNIKDTDVESFKEELQTLI